MTLAARFERFFRYALLFLAIVSLLSFILVALIRMSFPYEAEWIEEGVLVHVERVLHGLPVYVEPSLEYVPFVYTPLFYYLSALASKIIGGGFAPLRLVSILATLGTFTLIFFFVKKETKDNFSAILASCFYASCYSAVQFWFDLGRVDSLTFFFLFSFIFLIRFYHTYISYIIAGIVVTLSFLSKQEGLSLSVPVILFLYFIDWKKALVLTISTLVSLISAVFIFDSIGNGLFSYYTIILPFEVLQESAQTSRLVSIWTKDLIGQTPILIILYIYFLIFGKKYFAKDKFIFYLFVSLFIIIGSLPYRTIRYGNTNALMPAFAILSIIGGISFYLIRQQLDKVDKGIVSQLKILIYFIAIIHFVSLIYTPAEVLPSKIQAVNEANLVTQINTIKGPVFVPSHGRLAMLAQKPGSAHIAGLDDLLNSDASGYRDYLYNDLMSALKTQRFGAIVLDQFWFTHGDELMAQLRKYYEIEKDDAGSFKTYKLSNQDFYRPTVIYVPKKPGQIEN
jgi:4-amino-4-deoxy-L-arabinose transferase-like glycosyltransferase